MIWNLVAWFERAFVDLERGCKFTERIDAAVKTVWQRILEDPSASTCCRSAQLSITRTSLQKIQKLDFKMFLHKIQMIQILLSQDIQQDMFVKIILFYIIQSFSGHPMLYFFFVNVISMGINTTI